MQVLRREEEFEQLKEYKLFMNSIKSEETKKAYLIYFKKYVEYLGDAKDILCNKDPIVVQDKIIEYINFLKQKGLTFSAVKNYVTAIVSYYKINDVMINSKKIFRFMPEQKRVKKDEAYTREQIQSLLDVADDRYRAIILLYSSSGIRLGAVPDLKVRNLKKMENDVYQVTVYENSKEEYTTFTTPECSKAIDKYLAFRKRCGEEINGESPLIREQFDIKNPFVISHPKKVRTETIDRILTSLSERAGLRRQEKLDKNGTKKGASCRKDVAVCHGFRKFFSSQLVNSEVNTERRWLLEGHNLKGNDSSYVRTSEKQLLDEYMKAVKNLTINEENRLLIKVKRLELENNDIENLKDQVGKIALGLNNLIEGMNKNKITIQNEK
ncbi:MAG TPA: tyrosine-type recombinase/integrase [Nitrososphaeraceae archaeon]|nr:tyrosine-type recombinase/integrase [Nitrososphaeraceae archaeon]